jgi:hypothetical protein
MAERNLRCLFILHRMVRLRMKADIAGRRRVVRRIVPLLLVASALHPLAGAAQNSQLLDSRVTQHSIGQTICRPGYADTVAPPFDQSLAVKNRLLAERGIGIADGPSWALDRRVPIVLGGSPTAEANLDLLPWSGRDGKRRKVLLTVRLKRCVCAGRISLAKAQTEIAGDWVREYGRLARMQCGSPNPSNLAAPADDGS